MSREHFTDVAFPLVVGATSERHAALVLLDRPLALPCRFTMRPESLERVRKNITTLFQPATLVHVNGTRWRFDETPSSPKRILAATVKSACDFLEIDSTRFAIVERLLDAYPELESRLLPVARATIRTDRVRHAQPLLAAMIVAHAASVAHLMKYG